MKHITVVAIKHGEQYIASVCYCDETENVLDMLKQSYDTANASLCFVSQGDSQLTERYGFLTFYQDLKYPWCKCRPVIIDSDEALAVHAKSIGASVLFIYDNDTWLERWRYGVDELLSIA